MHRDDMNIFLSVPEPLTPQWLTTVLRQAGILKEGSVKSVEKETTGAFNSHTSHLFLHYSADTSGEAPRRLVLKQSGQSAWGQEAGMEEVKFYRLVASLPDHPSVIIPCYAAATEEQSRNSYVLLQDLSETHRPPITRDQQISLVEGYLRQPTSKPLPGRLPTSMPTGGTTHCLGKTCLISGTGLGMQSDLLCTFVAEEPHGNTFWLMSIRGFLPPYGNCMNRCWFICHVIGAVSGTSFS